MTGRVPMGACDLPDHPLVGVIIRGQRWRGHAPEWIVVAVEVHPLGEMAVMERRDWRGKRVRESVNYLEQAGRSRTVVGRVA